MPFLKQRFLIISNYTVINKLKVYKVSESNKNMVTKSEFVMVCGLAGSGKTTLAKNLVRSYDAIYLDKDDVQDAFTKERSGAFYQIISRPAYQAVYNIAHANLNLGKNVVLVAPFVGPMQNKTWRDYMTYLADDSNSVIKVIWCYADEQTIKERLRSRGCERDLEKLGNWSEFIRREPLKIEIPFDHIEVDTGIRYDINDVINFLKTKQN